MFESSPWQQCEAHYIIHVYNHIFSSSMPHDMKINKVLCRFSCLVTLCLKMYGYILIFQDLHWISILKFSLFFMQWDYYNYNITITYPVVVTGLWIVNFPPIFNMQTISRSKLSCLLFVGFLEYMHISWWGEVARSSWFLPQISIRTETSH